MRKEFLNKLCCPIDKADLKTQIFLQDEEGQIIEALMTCPKCKRYYPVIYGIPIMTPDEFREKALEEPLLKKWGKLETLNLEDNQEKILELDS
ncbi:Trm112 family protein [Croceivirga radicis]|uniref:Trm112 family protein n=1 Tax=Croceivirga radicis TaxID=1929488 RepID=A0A1V6LSN3_9FLAO|nr:Trm112 family protein [Croceivirga radicis]OQD42986.1 hypothetical protein BUL40_07790 [Croceivirga radicis]